jgi:hypothetical protein
VSGISGISSVALGFLNFCEDFLSGGLGGGGGRCLFLAFSFLAALSPSFTVELDDDEVRDSLTDARP